MISITPKLSKMLIIFTALPINNKSWIYFFYLKNQFWPFLIHMFKFLKYMNIHHEKTEQTTHCHSVTLSSAFVYYWLEVQPSNRLCLHKILVINVISGRNT